MNKKKLITKSKTIKTTIGIIIFPIFLLLATFAAFFFDTHYITSQLETHSKINTTNTTIQLYEYFADGIIPAIFTEQEASHLADVKKIVQKGKILLLLITIILAAALYYGNPWTILYRGSIIFFFIIIALLLIPFDTIFDKFHHILFPQGNWTFPTNSTIIQHYPPEFFAAFLRHVLFTALGTATALFLITKNTYSKSSQKRDN